MMMMKVGEHVYEIQQEMFNASMMSRTRADPDWVLIDGHDHRHNWYTLDRAGVHHARSPYIEDTVYVLPTMIWVQDSPGSPEDSEEWWPPRGHWECRLCREHIEPKTITEGPIYRQVPGLRSCYIDGLPVSKEEFYRRLNADLAARGFPPVSPT